METMGYLPKLSSGLPGGTSEPDTSPVSHMAPKKEKKSICPRSPPREAQRGPWLFLAQIQLSHPSLCREREGVSSEGFTFAYVWKGWEGIEGWGSAFTATSSST